MIWFALWLDRVAWQAPFQLPTQLTFPSLRTTFIHILFCGLFLENPEPWPLPFSVKTTSRGGLNERWIGAQDGPTDDLLTKQFKIEIQRLWLEDVGILHCKIMQNKTMMIMWMQPQGMFYWRREEWRKYVEQGIVTIPSIPGRDLESEIGWASASIWF